MNNKIRNLYQKKLNVNICSMKIQNMLLVTFLCFFSLSCSKDSVNDFETQSKNDLILEFDLKTTNNVKTAFEFKTVDEARKFLVNRRLAQKTYKFQGLDSISISKLKSADNKQHFSFDLIRKNLVRLKSGQTEGQGYYTDIDWGLFSTMKIDFSTDSSGLIPGSINSYIYGIQLSDYVQNNSYVLDNNSFVIEGSITYTIGIGELGYDVTDRIKIYVDIDTETMTASYTYEYIGT